MYIPAEKELCNQIKQIKKHVTNFSAMLTDLNSGQTCKYITKDTNDMEVRVSD